jgi:hypothetical protein
MMPNLIFKVSTLPKVAFFDGLQIAKIEAKIGSGFQVDKLKQASYVSSSWHANHASTFLVDFIMLSSEATVGRMFF